MRRWTASESRFSWSEGTGAPPKHEKGLWPGHARKVFQIFNENDKNQNFTSLRGQLLGFREN